MDFDVLSSRCFSKTYFKFGVQSEQLSQLAIRFSVLSLWFTTAIKERSELGEIFEKTYRRRSSRFATKWGAKTVKSTTENRMLQLRNTS